MQRSFLPLAASDVDVDAGRQQHAQDGGVVGRHVERREAPLVAQAGISTAF